MMSLQSVHELINCSITALVICLDASRLSACWGKKPRTHLYTGQSIIVVVCVCAFLLTRNSEQLVIPPAERCN